MTSGYECRRLPLLPLKKSIAMGSSFTPPELVTFYNVSTGFDETEQCIAVIKLGTSDRTADILAYFQATLLCHLEADASDNLTETKG